MIKKAARCRPLSSRKPKSGWRPGQRRPVEKISVVDVDYLKTQSGPWLMFSGGRRWPHWSQNLSFLLVHEYHTEVCYCQTEVFYWSTVNLGRRPSMSVFTDVFITPKRQGVGNVAWTCQQGTTKKITTKERKTWAKTNMTKIGASNAFSRLSKVSVHSIIVLQQLFL